jgi:hypothetical protein
MFWIIFLTLFGIEALNPVPLIFEKQKRRKLWEKIQVGNEEKLRIWENE